MENTLNTSEKFGELAGALAKAQTEFKPVLKDSDNPYYNSKYADLATVIAATQPALAKNGLVVIQSPIVDTELEKAGVVTVLAHSSGEWMSHELALPATMKGKKDKQTGEEGPLRFDAQSVGSAITYARRYSYQAIVGVAAEVDDDGNAASDNQRASGSAQAGRAVATEKLKQAAKGDETVTIAPYKEGYVALSGGGLPIIRANLDGKMMAELGWKWEGKTAMILAAKAFNFVDLCEKHKVGTILMDAQTAPSTITPKATIPPFVPAGNGERRNTDDPIITAAKRVKGNKPGAKEFLSVEWNGAKASCWNKSMWPHLEHHVGRPAVLTLETKGQYTNVVGIVSLDGEEFFSEPIEPRP